MSNYVEFNNSLVTGNKEIDEQHQEWIDRINKLLGSCESGCGCKVEAVKMLDYMAEYTEFHFNEEEKLQEEVSYPGIEAHKEKHSDFKKAVEELHEMLVEVEGPTEEFVQAVNKNVIDWLYDHIKGFDRAVAEYISQNA